MSDAASDGEREAQAQFKIGQYNKAREEFIQNPSANNAQTLRHAAEGAGNFSRPKTDEYVNEVEKLIQSLL